MIFINNVFSDMRLIATGVPQGSILGPLLFLIYINGLPICSKFKTFLFADDTTLLYSHENLQTLEKIVNEELWKVNNYFRYHKMALHSKKTKFILYSQNIQVRNSDINIFINNSNNINLYLENPNDQLLAKLERVKSEDKIPAIRFLGVFFDPNLNFNYHIQILTSKLAKTLYIMRNSKNFITKRSLRLIYFSLFHSHLIYCLPIWSCTSQNNLNKVFQLQKSAIRILDNAKYNSHTEPLFKKHSILPLEKLISFFNLQFIFFYKTNKLPVSYNNMWEINPYVEENMGREPELVQVQLRPRGYFVHKYSRLATNDKFPLYNLTRLWDNFPDQIIKNLNSKEQFNGNLKRFYFNQLSENVICNRLLCPVCHFNN